MSYQGKPTDSPIVPIKGTESQAVGNSSYGCGRSALPETRDPNRNIPITQSVIFWDAIQMGPPQFRSETELNAYELRK